MKRGTLIALSLMAGTLVFLATQKRSGQMSSAAGGANAEGGADKAPPAKAAPDKTPPAITPGGKHVRTPEEKAAAAAKTRVMLLESYNVLVAQAATNPSSVDPNFDFEELANMLQGYHLPDQAHTIKLIASNTRNRQRARALITKEEQQGITSISSEEEAEMGRLVLALTAIGEIELRSELEKLIAQRHRS